MKIVLLGAGNLATQLAKALNRNGLPLEQIYSRTEASAARLAQTVGCHYTTRLDRLAPADLYICALKDSVLEGVLQQVPDFGQALWVHTSGSLPMNVFEKHTHRYGVFYPLQTFSRGRDVAFDQIPICLETARPEDMPPLQQLASALSRRVVELSSGQRATLHLAAVFANNFSNCLYDVAAGILSRDGLDFSLLLPLIDETAAKVHGCTPFEAQTGPAVRMDMNVVSRHLQLLKRQKDESAAELYLVLSELINSRHQL